MGRFIPRSDGPGDRAALEAAQRLAEPVSIGPVVDGLDVLACRLCGVVVWDFAKHEAHAHPKPGDFR